MHRHPDTRHSMIHSIIRYSHCIWFSFHSISLNLHSHFALSFAFATHHIKSHHITHPHLPLAFIWTLFFVCATLSPPLLYACHRPPPQNAKREAQNRRPGLGADRIWVPSFYLSSVRCRLYFLLCPLFFFLVVGPLFPLFPLCPFRFLSWRREGGVDGMGLVGEFCFLYYILCYVVLLYCTSSFFDFVKLFSFELKRRCTFSPSRSIFLC